MKIYWHEQNVLGALFWELTQLFPKSCDKTLYRPVLQNYSSRRLPILRWQSNKFLALSYPIRNPHPRTENYKHL